MLADGVSCYPNSSGDQHTILFYGLWRYVQSPMATDAHKAAVIGDTVGDPLKDTVGPSINILIKLMSVISLVLAPLFMRG